MEFVNEQEVLSILKDLGIAPEEEPAGDDEDQLVHLRLKDSAKIVRVFLSTPGSSASPRDGARTIESDVERIAQIVEDTLVQMHLSEALMIPVGKWRKVFDCVAFSLAENEAWTEIDATASVELNRRDPLLCRPSDFHTLRALVQALLQDADQPDQNLMITTTAAPVLIEVLADGAVQINVGNEVLAEELIGSLA